MSGVFSGKFIVLAAGVALAGLGLSAGLSVLLGGRAVPPPGAPAGLATGPAEGPRLAAPPPQSPRELAAQQHQLEALIRELKVRLGDCQGREAGLDQRERHLAAAEEGLKRRAQELETLRMQLVGPLTRLREAKADLENSYVLLGRQEKANIARIAATFEKMDPARGAEILAGMCANQQFDDVVKILYAMSERASAKILGEVADKALAARLTAMMQKVRQQS